MLTQIKRIGNSKGIIIPAKLLKQFGIKDQVYLDVEGESIIISKAGIPRNNWVKAFETVGINNQDTVLADFINEFDTDDWTW
ncbi:hypothetical protein KORDIASMS9_01836 [Kordia sp. SMS9]|uniref:AbrB/MazE/SpoVT family DNA-binding domain-containing protein n=1 Tax=Kordia sp. SMS9 TaxID=2282170 RepID=UPI000E0DA083|nr:AbrB/MazE/SpoVT family DNA-binding domain-containing protein [Kordia sp. SMS9]AXG69611.1 hypothetical protein KORDIASMS9_01836 [Kordia sp. SMS9]